MKTTLTAILTLVFFIIWNPSHAQWEQILSDTNVLSVYVSDTNIFVGTEDGKVYLTSDFGQTWQNLSYNLPNDYIDNIGMSDSNKLVCTCGRFVYVSADWEGWTEVYQLPSNITCMTIDGPKIYVGGEIEGGIHGSFDNGNTWDDLNGNLNNRYLTSITYNDTSLMISVFGGLKVFYSVDNGVNWNPHNQGISGNIFSITNNDGFFAGGENRIYKLIDGVWTPIHYTSQIWDFACDTSYFSACGGESTPYLYLSKDSGNTWETIEATYTVGKIRSTDIYNDYILAGNHDGLYGYKVTPVHIHEEMGEQLDCTSFPNPFTTTTTIEFELYTRTSIQYSVYNSIGELVHKELLQSKAPGSYTITLPLQHLPAGLYYGVFSTEAEMSVLKMVKE